MFIDSHAHIDGPEFDADRDEIIERAQAAGVSVILNVGTGDPHSGALERAVALGQKHDSVYTAIGTHPHDARLYDNSPRDVQVEVFKRQLRAARECGLPVVIHTREAESETIEILKSEHEGASRRGIFHCFSGSKDLAQRALELGFMISFSGIVTFKKAEELRAVAREVPLGQLLIETDCPYLAPIPFRGKRNEPAYVIEVARCLAGIHGVDIDEVGRVTSDNFRRFFKI